LYFNPIPIFYIFIILSIDTDNIILHNDDEF
jgi:hypothetical protein